MAKRVFFIIKDNRLIEEEIEFKYFNGFSITQKQKSIISFHNEILKSNNGNIIEISSKSLNNLGVNLSAFNLKVNYNGKKISLENIFQASKVFEYGGPYTDLLDVSPVEAKKDERIRNSGKLVAFELSGNKYTNYPKTAFYDWIYCCSLLKNPILAKELVEYDIFTDIEFNNEKSINCQARSAGIFVLLYKLDKLEILKNFDEFKKYVYDQLYFDNLSFTVNNLFSYMDWFL